MPEKYRKTELEQKNKYLIGVQAVHDRFWELASQAGQGHRIAPLDIEREWGIFESLTQDGYIGHDIVGETATRWVKRVVVNGIVIAERTLYLPNYKRPAADLPSPFEDIVINGKNDKGEDISMGIHTYYDADKVYDFYCGGMDAIGYRESRGCPITAEAQTELAGQLGIKI